MAKGDLQRLTSRAAGKPAALSFGLGLGEAANTDIQVTGIKTRDLLVAVLAAVRPGASGSDGAAATLTTALTGTNNDLVFTAKDDGAEGNDITVRYVVAGANTPLTVSVSGRAITVNVATDGSSAATSTAAQVKTAVDASTAASALVSVANAGGNDGTGVVTALTATALSGGTDASSIFVDITSTTTVTADGIVQSSTSTANKQVLVFYYSV